MPAPGLLDRVKARIAALTRDANTFWTDQFNNADALDGYANIGHELVEQVGRVDAFVGGVGTGGMLMGVVGLLGAVFASRQVDSAAWLDAWPDQDRSTRIVVISQGLDARWLQDLLELLDEEVQACSIS